MNVITYPKAYQSAFREACFVLDGLSASAGLDVGIYTPDVVEPLGVKRIYADGQASVNVAPYVRSLLAPVPLCDRGPGMTAASGRAVACSVGAAGYASAYVYLTGGTDDPSVNAILSAFAGTAKIRRGEKDEISVITGGNPVVPAVTFEHGGVEYTCNSFSPLSATGMLTFVVDADAIGGYFSGLTGADASEMGGFTVWLRTTAGSSDVYMSRRYEVGRNACGGRRLAWLNRYGAVDYYTFPHDAGGKSTGSRERIYTAEGYRTIATSGAKSQTLLSDQADAAMAEWLSEIFSSPRVWAVEGSDYSPVEIAAGSAEYSGRRPGTVSVSVSSLKKPVSRKA